MATFSDGLSHPNSLDFPFHSSSSDDMRQHLQNLLDGKEKQLQQAAALGERLLAQRVELEERVRLLQEMDADKSDEITADMRERYRELADAVRTWDFGNVQLTTAFTSSSANTSITSQSFEVQVHEPLRDEPERPKPVPGTSAAQSRRAKNAAHRADDVEFAFEIGSGLLTEVRRLQSLLAERDKAIQDMKEEKDDLEKSAESLRGALKSQEQSTDKYKEENWNLEVTLQELRIQFADSQSTVQRLESEHKRLTRQLNKAREATDQHKNEAERLKNSLEDLKANHETAIAQARKQAASLQRDKSDLQQSLDSLKAEMARLNRRLPRMGSPMTPEGRERSDLLTPHDREMDDVFSPAPSTNRRRGDTSAMFSADGEYDSSPDVSPSRPFQAPNHPSNEVEALQQRLAHAQRQINTLKSTLQREKELKIEYRKRLDGSPAIGTGLNTEEFVSDEDTEDGTPGTGKKPRRLGTFSVGRGGRGRSRGRGGITLIQRLEHAARSLTPEYDGDEDFGALTSTPPQLTTLPVFFGGGAEADDEPEPDYHDEEPAVDPPSNRGSLDGLDPAFANVLRRSSSSGSLPYNRSPLRQAVVSRTLPRRSRGGAAFQEARPASLVGQPEALAAELFGTGIGMDSVAEIETAVATAEFGCQTEFKEASPQLPPPIQITPADPETSDFGVQVQVEPEVPEQKLVIDISMQTDPEPIRQPKVAIERADIGVQHEIIGFSRSYAESSIETDPTVERKSTPPASLPVISLHAEVQTLSVQTAQIEVQTLPILAPEKVDVEMQTVSVSSPLVLGFDGSHTNDGLWRDDTIMQPALSHDTSGDTTIYGGIFASEHEQAEEEFDDAITETGVETDTDADYQDARQSIVLTTPTASMEEYQSMQTFSDEEGEEDDDDAESIKASMLAYRRDTESEVLPVTPPPERAPTGLLPVTYESQAVQAEAFEEPAPVLVSAPGFVSTPELVSAVVPEAPKPELREISVQTDRWVSTPPASPVHSRGTSLLGAFKVSGVGTQQFQYIAPHSAGPVASVTPIHSVPPSPSAVRDSVATIIPVPRSLSHDRRQSIELALSSADENTPRSRIPSVAPAPVDKSRPPMMMLPPPPRAPPPPNSMPPPHFIPERRIPTSSISSHDVAPGRPISPPPTELIQRATTPTFGSLRGGLPRQHGSSLPPAALGLASRPSTHSFRSAANATSHVHGVAPPTIVSIFGRDRDRVREMSTTSLQSDRSLGSGRSSMSSDNHYYPARSQSRATNAPQTVNGFPQNGAADPSTRGTDPAVLHAITQTMIGEFLYKYTRRTIGRGHGEKRHKRFFWVHPYTRTLYWSDADPGSSNVSESSAKSAYIEGVRSVLDPNPLPPGLHQYSVVVSTPFREMKFTAPTKERHDIWLNALQYLLTRPGTLLPSSTANGPNGAITGPGAAPLSPITGRAELPLEDTRPDHHNTRLLASPQSFRSGRSLHVSGDTWGTTPRGQRSTSQLSMGGSIGKRSGTPAAEYLRYAGPEGPYSPTKSFEQVQGGVGEDEELDFELHDESMSENGFEGLENVRACCDGLHTVGGHHHHHPHHHHPHRDDPPPGRSRMRDGHLDTHAHADPPRPSSPAWSFRSRSGSTASHDGGLFSGKLRFGSRRSAKTSTATSAMEVHTQLQPA
ncbi:hypothetical protein B0F90DRAFT_1630116 [Multifurca ochricompacta]|uniref:PH domain-containing protein n=1 Tax=Multifurca ochricompacta TaxID=376703 RepID=A0AAD4M3P1_9AGAM|nr:hypothetical protein B0F90DRAFT_1630116 [Multifurca ochricompacta]